MVECRLNEIFAERGMKKGWFANKIGVNASTLSGWCTNKTVPELEQAYRVALELDLNVMEIWVVKQNGATE
ncbi:helix-turn-helix transcriptional regulator [Paenibacillus anseongense]|uniref:helix-turn-helix transcriptional regulator n=1 Tax=Paenibacillus anseongense TaxID=2682845 RepID=UPI002DBFE25D|nr:helix-turn-helix transcriptional regulator [Paenibacillus anseongense]MEC0265173.1 helix-turn-helix transcriptional regulator [Paenibacillus anseongense]